VSRRQLHSVYTLQATSLGQVAEYRTLQPTATDWCDTAEYVMLLPRTHTTFNQCNLYSPGSAVHTSLASPSDLHYISNQSINQSYFYVVWATNSCCKDHRVNAEEKQLVW